MPGRELKQMAGNGPLAGIQVIELAGLGPAPFCGMMLGDLGAEIIRIDRAGEAPWGIGDILGRGRKSIAVDLKKPGAAAIVLRLVADADAFIEGFRPGVAERLGAELQTLLAKAFGEERQSPEDLLALAWPVLASRRGDRVFALFFEMIGFASSGQEPYPTMVRGLMDAWRDWLAERVVGDRIDVRRRRALSVMARIDGLLLMRRTMGNDAAVLAAREMGIA